MTQRLRQYPHPSARGFRAATRASWLAIASVAALSALTPHTSSAQSAKTNLNDLVISGAKIIHRKTKAIVLDADNLVRTIEGAGKYFDVMKGEFKTCGRYNDASSTFHHQLSLNGDPVACVHISSVSGIGPYYMVITAPLRDFNGGHPGAKLAHLQNFRPSRDCKAGEGYLTCAPELPPKDKTKQLRHFYTMDGGCNGVDHVPPEDFKRQQNSLKVCAVFIFGNDPQG